MFNSICLNLHIKVKNQLVTISFFRFATFSDCYWAFKMMQLAHGQIVKEANGLTFYKLLGSGGVDGFSWKPNFAVYAFLGVWEDESYAKDFFDHATIFQQYKQKSVELFTTYMHTIQSHGKWSSKNPFEPTTKESSIGPIAVITRATIRKNKLLSFWKRVSGVSVNLNKYNGRKFSIGIGEWPLVQQATFSIWDSKEEMMEYAYKDPFHKLVIQLTREKKWYKEELFARFFPYKSDGQWNGKEVLF